MANSAIHTFSKLKRLRYIITGGALSIVFAHLFYPDLKIDAITLGLLGFAVLPWLQPLLKSLEIGGVKVEMQDYAQGETENPAKAAQVTANTEINSSYDPVARLKILATLWRYQQINFKDEPLKRWTFAVFPIAPDYASYLRGLAQLVTEGIVVVQPENYQCTLNNEGYEYCKKHAAKLDAHEDYYHF